MKTAESKSVFRVQLLSGGTLLVEAPPVPLSEAQKAELASELHELADVIKTAGDAVHEPDLDGNCESCGLLIGFSHTHLSADCIRELKEKFAGSPRVDAAIELLRKSFSDDGAEGESVHVVCREVERLRREVAKFYGKESK